MRYVKFTDAQSASLLLKRTLIGCLFCKLNVGVCEIVFQVHSQCPDGALYPADRECSFLQTPCQGYCPFHQIHQHQKHRQHTSVRFLPFLYREWTFSCLDDSVLCHGVGDSSLYSAYPITVHRQYEVPCDSQCQSDL